MKTINFFFLFPFFSILTFIHPGNTAPGHKRRTLHQPFFPPDTPAVPPSSQSNLPFTPNPTTTASPPADRPFFQNLPSPPPPPPASFPANIPSINLPNSPKSKPVSSKLIATAVTLVFAAGIVVAIVVYLRIQKRRRYDHDSGSFSDKKSNRTDSGSRVVVSYNINNGTGSDNIVSMIPKLSRPSQSSAELLYLGTLVNPNGEPDNHHEGEGESNLRKMDSAELRPLPPLNSVGRGGRSGGNFRNNSIENVDVESSNDEEYEIFYSPGGSMGTGSDARSELVVQVDDYVSEKVNGSDSSSCSSSSSGSVYPARSMSLSISPPGSLSPVRSSPNSPDLVTIQTTSPPAPPTQMSLSLVIRSPDIRLSNVESSPGLSDSSSDQNSPPAAARIPPPPPPPPKNWQTSPKTPTPSIRPQVLITPARPVPLTSDKPPVFPTKLSPENQQHVENPKPKLKPLHWDKVRASSDRETVWDQLKSSSFKLNEEMIESLFVVKTPKSSGSSVTNRPMPPLPPASQENRVLDPKKAQNIAISLRALNVTIEEICDALLEGNADTLGADLLESLMKMAPTKEEEWKLKEYKDDLPVKLGPAEKFLKAVLDVPFAFKRVDAMLYISNFESEVEYLTRSFQTLELACEELRNSRMFLKLLEAVLKAGNRMNVGTNRGDAQAFKLDTLLKLIDVKGTDGKTTLLHFVVQEIIKSEGARLSTPDTTPTSDTKCRKLGLQLVTKISSELTNVKKAAAIDAEVLNSDVTKLSKGISDISQVVRLNDTILDRNRFSESMNMFMQTAEEEIIRIQMQESVVFSLVKEVTEYFHGNSAKEEAHPFRIFTVVRDFLNVLDRVCKEVGSINDHIVIGSSHRFPVPVNPTLPAVFSGLPENRRYSCSDNESSSSFRSS